MRQRDLVSSDTSLGIGDHLQRPADLPCLGDPAVVALTVFMAERMNVALNLLNREDCKSAQRRLCRWWFDCSVHLSNSPAVVIVRKQLKQIDPWEQSAAFAWFAGHWHENRHTMCRLLWRIQCSPYVVTGASLLHVVGSGDEEGSRGGRKVSSCSGN